MPLTLADWHMTARRLTIGPNDICLSCKMIECWLFWDQCADDSVIYSRRRVALDRPLYGWSAAG